MQKVAKDGGVLKQFSTMVPVEDWQNVRLEAARQKIPMSEWVRNTLEPALKKLREKATS